MYAFIRSLGSAGSAGSADAADAAPAAAGAAGAVGGDSVFCSLAIGRKARRRPEKCQYGASAGFPKRGHFACAGLDSAADVHRPLRSHFEPFAQNSAYETARGE